MKILTGSGPKQRLIETSHRFPMLNHKLAHKKSRLHRLVRTGKAPPLTKEQARSLCEQAAAEHPITRIERGPPTVTSNFRTLTGR
jgi:hypothetical protein